MVREACAADRRRFGVVTGAAVFLGELGKRNRRRILLDRWVAEVLVPT